ncbi:hypothetical protein Pcinc_025158 [Petrolisthes cinctipes]|uniref:PiggyBac transposable element-derived protein domain-containing protein n=1 Tax=Petrolisthes cinctipes TaxID=88211 RepID=A0AAE1F9Q7_PETCI|nr:hypothetical protein Pcinc_025158 [Petrolisthes cinctipes]
MESSSNDSSDEVYSPGVSGESETSSDSIDELSDMNLLDNNEPIEEAGWRLVSDIFADTRPEPPPAFSDPHAGVNDRLDKKQFSSPGAAFRYFFDDEVIYTMCNWINKRATVYFEANPDKSKVHGLTWHPVTPDELYVFLGLIIVMGVVKLPDMHMYWSHNVIFGGPEIFSHEVMSRNRFFSILKFLRFASPDLVDKNNPHTRIEPYLDLLRDRCQTLIRPSRHIAIDEALVLWKGRLGFRQVSKTKRAHFGVKVFVLCPSGERWDGYSWNYALYYDKSNFKIDDPNASQLTVSEDIVVYLMKDLLDQGRHIITDNWYTSSRLSDYLLTRDTMLTGVVRSGRGPPTIIQKEKLEKNQAVFARKNNTLVVKYQDKIEVTVLTTKYNAGMVEKTKTYFGNKTVFFNKPLHIDKYNKKMGSVDLADQLLEPYVMQRKSLAWFKKLGIHFMFRTLLNAFVFYRNECLFSGDFLDFIMAVSTEWLRENSRGANEMLTQAEMKSMKKPMKLKNEMEVVHEWVRHEKRGKQKRCRVCFSKEKKRKDTTNYCPGCPGEPGLCSVDHFKEWHTGSTVADDPRTHTSGVPTKKKCRV